MAISRNRLGPTNSEEETTDHDFVANLSQSPPGGGKTDTLFDDIPFGFFSNVLQRKLSNSGLSRAADVELQLSSLKERNEQRMQLFLGTNFDLKCASRVKTVTREAGFVPIYSRGVTNHKINSGIRPTYIIMNENSLISISSLQVKDLPTEVNSSSFWDSKVKDWPPLMPSLGDLKMLANSSAKQSETVGLYLPLVSPKTELRSPISPQGQDTTSSPGGQFPMKQVNLKARRGRFYPRTQISQLRITSNRGRPQHNGNKRMSCSLCLSNHERRDIAHSHQLKTKIRGRNVTTCPVLRNLVCPKCKATGDNAHTITYCPITIMENDGVRPASIANSLKQSRTKSSGQAN